MFVLKEGGESRHPHPPAPSPCDARKASLQGEGESKAESSSQHKNPVVVLFVDSSLRYALSMFGCCTRPLPHPDGCEGEAGQQHGSWLLFCSLSSQRSAGDTARRSLHRLRSSAFFSPSPLRQQGEGAGGVRVTRDLPLSYSPVGWALQRMRPSVSHRGLPLHVSITHPAEFGSPRTKRATEMTE